MVSGAALVVAQADLAAVSVAALVVVEAVATASAVDHQAVAVPAEVGNIAPY